MIRKLVPVAFAALALFWLPGCSPSQDAHPEAANETISPPVVKGAGEVGPLSGLLAESADQNSNELAQLLQKRTQHKPDLGIGPGDVLEISVAGVDELQKKQVRVDGDGSVNLPLLGRLDVGGLSEQQFTELVKEKLHKFMYHPDVQVFVTSYNSREVAITGAVHNPGLLTINNPNETLRNMLHRAGGPTELAGRRLLLTPGQEGAVGGIKPAAFDTANPGTRGASQDTGQKLLIIDTDQKYDDRYLDLPVRPGDAIYVPPGGNVTVVGWVYTPKTVQVSPGLTVLQAISAAGGPLFAADKTSIKLIRQNSVGSPEVFALNLNQIENLQQTDIPVRDGDVVQVPYSVARIPGYGVYYAAQSLITYGPFMLVSGGI